MIAELGLGPLVGLISFFYSMVGWAGGSAYAALFAGSGLEPGAVKILSLSLNVWVSMVGVVQFGRAGFFRPRLALSYAVLSVPAAWVGSCVPLDRGPFFLLIGFCLLIAGSRLLLTRVSETPVRPASARRDWAVGLAAGGIFGFLSGLAGIGGGIFLTPFLVLTRRASLREAAAASSFFILINSLSGLWARGQWIPVPPGNFSPLAFWALAGGLAGSSLGSGLLPVRFMRGALAAFLFLFSFTAFFRVAGLW